MPFSCKELSQLEYRAGVIPNIRASCHETGPGHRDLLWEPIRMKTLQQFAAKPETIPASTSWYLADLGEARGKQALFTKQSPQRLKVLREHALIESAVSSDRIEGVTVDRSRVGTVLFGKSLLKDRDEEEVRGYRDALKLIHEQGSRLPVSEQTIKKLHRLTRGDIWDAENIKTKTATSLKNIPTDGSEYVLKRYPRQKPHRRCAR